MNLILFVQIVAWPLMVLSGLLLILRLYGAWDYHGSKHADLKKVIDDIRGVRRTFPITKPFILFLISLAAIVSTW